MMTASVKEYAAAAAMAAILLSTACFGADLSGTFVPPFPDGMKEESAACIASALGPERVCDYSIGLLRTPGGLLFYLGKSAPRVDPKNPRWLIMDQMPFPEKSKGEEVVYGMCERNGAIDQTILAVAKREDAELYTKVRVAYRANLKTERFEAIPTAGIACVDDGWGL